MEHRGEQVRVPVPRLAVRQERPRDPRPRAAVPGPLAHERAGRPRGLLPVDRDRLPHRRGPLVELGGRPARSRRKQRSLAPSSHLYPVPTPLHSAPLHRTAPHRTSPCLRPPPRHRHRHRGAPPSHCSGGGVRAITISIVTMVANDHHEQATPAVTTASAAASLQGAAVGVRQAGRPASQCPARPSGVALAPAAVRCRRGHP
mmetsp:Transcript_684/g.2504  ORF Transcript_684/g.2504 Transcript_684/m.2504 type:complete len:202 (-) Transcript_684:148-753(-)